MKICLLIISLLSTFSFANVVGLSNQPLGLSKSIFTTEFNGYLSNGSGAGLTLRYLHHMNENLSLEGGIGMGSGDRKNRVFFGGDVMIFPDYIDQPRISMKGLLESSSEFGNRHNKIGLIPTISKGFNFWGKEAYPFLALPMRLNLNSERSTFESSIALAAGITGKIPVEAMKKMIANIELNLGLENTYTSLVFGLSYPL